MDNPQETVLFVVVKTPLASQLHARLKGLGWLDPGVEPLHGEGDAVGFPVVSNVVATDLENNLSLPHTLVESPPVFRDPVDPHDRLREAVRDWLSMHGSNERLLEALPTKWERLGDLVLLPGEVMSQAAWQSVRSHPSCQRLWEAMITALKARSLGIQRPIANDTYRSAQVEMLLGSSQVEFLDHGITYIFDAGRVMFSSGNVTERRRIGSMKMAQETVIDAYAGVGYYTLPMLVNAQATHVHACEINPASIEGLRAAAQANDVEAKLTIHEGDNAVALRNLRGVADRCHLGLLPSSEPVWEACLLALKPSGGMLHVHMNVEEENLEAWSLETVEHFEALVKQHRLDLDVEALHLERVKWFAPRVRHVVLDLMFRPRPTT